MASRIVYLEIVPQEEGAWPVFECFVSVKDIIHAGWMELEQRTIGPDGKAHGLIGTKKRVVRFSTVEQRQTCSVSHFVHPESSKKFWDALTEGAARAMPDGENNAPRIVRE